MPSLHDPRLAATRLLPSHGVTAAGIFGIQDRTVAGGLLGSAAVMVRTQGLVRLPQPPVGPASPAPLPAAAAHAPPAAPAPPAAAPAPVLQKLQVSASHVALPVLVAVSPTSIHLCSWEELFGTAAELARFDRSATTVSVERFRRARRMLLTETRSGYQVGLTCTVSRLNSFGAGAAAVLKALSTSPVTLSG